MKKNKKPVNRVLYFIMLIFFLEYGCTKKAEPVNPKPIDSLIINNVKKIVILGNSIVHYNPSQALGWNGDWGMAASSADKDFVHILIKRFQKVDTTISVQYKNIAEFEFSYTYFPFNKLDSFCNKDLIIMKIGENVNAYNANYPLFIGKYNQLIHYLDSNNKAVKIIVDGFWENEKVNNDIRNYARNKNFGLVSITNISHPPSNKGFADHPNDIGMQLIADRIWNYINNN